MKWWRRARRRIVAGAIYAAATLGLGAILATVLFVAVARGAQPDFRPITGPALSAEQKALIDQTPHYRRAVDDSYLSFPEWYLVFNPQEYGDFIRQRRPSQFPYFHSIGQFWRGYADVYGITRPYYPFNFGENLMIVVIGTSSTVEWVTKGVYENSVGRASEWLGGGTDTAEDRYAADVARDYGRFIPTQPWFDFPFGHKLAGLWRSTDFFGPHFLRKLERKFALTTEYGVKSLYAMVIRVSSHAVYGVADDVVYLSAADLSAEALTVPDVKRIKPLGPGRWVVTVPHYQGFTDTVPVLARLGVNFEEIAGNDEILLTIVTPRDWTYDLSAGRPLFKMEFLANPTLQRVAIQAPVRSLGQMLREIDARHLSVEHLFDY